MGGCQESSSSEDIDRTDVLMVSQGSLRRADDPLPQLVQTVRVQNYPPGASQAMYHKHADSSRQSQHSSASTMMGSEYLLSS